MSCKSFALMGLVAGFAVVLNGVVLHADEKSDRVMKAKQLQMDKKIYPRGCSDFVSEVLGKKKEEWQDAKTLMGDSPTSVGKDNKYKGLTPGDVVGWKNKSPEHVAIYIGEPDCKFIDVQDKNMAPRKVKDGYGADELFKSSKY